ncbi:S8 family peptidase [Rhizobium sp. CSW-27]|uniref:S8 family peptidase n=1 Tax=Rhizobium sp. CSW-27 TaxID=2839985 RepID=UPI001C02167E|nr:S8 family peptidase [Rhizobium sp. CSW-27]MBT9371373.1 S8 family peptidase [Rhizobium sp. CSW-27]
MAEVRDQPLLYPVLSLQMDPALRSPTGRGKGIESIVTERLGRQQEVLASETRDIYEHRAELPTYSGLTHLVVRMFTEDSLAPTHTPDDLFSQRHGCRLVAPLPSGYLIEADIKQLPRLLDAIQRPVGYAVQADISRVSSLERFDAKSRLRGRSVNELWNSAPEDDDGRLFVVWLAPFRDRDAKVEVLERIQGFANERLVLPTFTSVRLTLGTSEEAEEPRALTTPRQSSIARAMRDYRNTGVGRATVRIPNKEGLRQLIASGASYRIDPVRPIRVAAPGEGAEPPAPVIDQNAPVVVVVDGGLHAKSYSAAEAFKATPFVTNAQADKLHGNCVSSLVVHGHAWNNNRLLPQLNCRIGSVQAVPHKNANRRFDERELVDYLTEVARLYPEARVWNISANQDGIGLDPSEVSVLGHEISLLARSAGFLPVISFGNVSPDNNSRPNPPADCEAAIVVGGRQALPDGTPGDRCPACLPGPGPDGMMKPDLSWFSNLRMLGGVVDTGSSYATPLVSSLAAHTFDSLREPTPDLVKALLINSAERSEHDPNLGWGTPYQGHLPWTCAPGSVTLAWRAQLEPGTAYYWNDIPIPPELVRDGKLFGRASLTAVLRPLVSPFGGANYFASRLETSLMYPTGPKKWPSLLGSMKESTLPENDAREELRKWQPIRRHCRDFTKSSGLGFSGSHMRLYARVYMRDLYQFGWTHHSQAGPQEVAFVLTLSSADGEKSIYDSTARALGNFVESAVLNQDIEVSNEI